MAIQQSEWFQSLLPHEQDIVTYTTHTRPGALSCDVSQSLGRHRVQMDPNMTQCATPSEKRFIIAKARLRTAYESLSLQGIPWEDMDITDFEPNVLASLAGNAWSGPVAMACVLAILLHLPFPAKH